MRPGKISKVIRLLAGLSESERLILSAELLSACDATLQNAKTFIDQLEIGTWLSIVAHMADPDAANYVPKD